MTNLAHESEESLLSEFSGQKDTLFSLYCVGESNINPVPHVEFLDLFGKIIVYDIPDSRYNPLSCAAFIHNIKW